MYVPKKRVNDVKSGDTYKLKSWSPFLLYLLCTKKYLRMMYVPKNRVNDVNGLMCAPKAIAH